MGILAEEQGAQRSRSQGSWGRRILDQVGKRECRDGRTYRLLAMNEMKLGSLASRDTRTTWPRLKKYRGWRQKRPIWRLLVPISPLTWVLSLWNW